MSFEGEDQLKGREWANKKMIADILLDALEKLIRD